jgi:hypothetical protein
LAGTLELQLNTTSDLLGPVLTRVGLPAEVSAQFYGFYDWGETWDRPSADPHQRLASTGGGVRLILTRATEVDLEGVYRLTRFPDGNTTGITALNAAAFYWRFLTRF